MAGLGGHDPSRGDAVVPSDRDAVGADAATPPGRAVAHVELADVSKSFGAVRALDAVSLTVARGSIHALVGENGAGKSTLMSILFGHYIADAGHIEAFGRPLAPGNPKAALAAGIGMVHQHFMLADNLTVLENIVLGSEPSRGGRLDLRTARRRIREISASYGLGIRPDQLVEELGVGARQRVEIAKVLYRGARILILDEPTAVLVPQEVDELFGLALRADALAPGVVDADDDDRLAGEQVA